MEQQLKEIARENKKLQESMKTALKILRVQKLVIEMHTHLISPIDQPRLESMLEGNGLAIKALQGGEAVIADEYFDYLAAAGVE